MKYLILFVLIGVVWWVWKKRNQSDQQSSQSHDPAPQKMLVCAQCGVYFPERDGLSDGGKVYCCEAHRLASREADGR
jgi:uncharacterized protein